MTTQDMVHQMHTWYEGSVLRRQEICDRIELFDELIVVLDALVKTSHTGEYEEHAVHARQLLDLHHIELQLAQQRLKR